MYNNGDDLAELSGIVIRDEAVRPNLDNSASPSARDKGEPTWFPVVAPDSLFQWNSAPFTKRYGRWKTNELESGRPQLD